MKQFYWNRRNVLRRKSFRCVTALLKCLTVSQNDNYVMNFVEDQYSINIALDEYLETSLVDVIHHLIVSGGNINKQDMQGNTLIHTAVKYENLEAICMLLYFEADINITNNWNNTAFTDALCTNNIDIILILMNFCDESAHKLIYKYYVSLLTKHSVNAHTLIKQAGSDKILVDSFMLFSRKINPDILLDNKEPFLETFLQICTYSASDWLKCLYLIFDFPNIARLMDQWNFTNSLWIRKPFIEKRIEHTDRVAVIWTWLSVGGLSKTGLHMWWMIWMYGFAEEMEALLYCSSIPERSDSTHYICSALLYPFISFNLDWDEDLKCFVEFEEFHNYKVIALILQFILNGSNVGNVARYVVMKSLQFFSLPYRCDEMLDNLRRTLFSLNCQKISQQVEVLPTVPSLVEQGRRTVRKIILEAHSIKKPYQFYDVVKQLHVPVQIKDIILFRKPIY